MEDENIEAHASVITQILVPVCITMAIVIALVKILNPPQSLGRYAAFLLWPTFPEFSLTNFLKSASSTTLYFEREGDSNAKKFGGAILNALIFVGIMILVTCLFVVLYKYRCMKVRVLQ